MKKNIWAVVIIVLVGLLIWFVYSGKTSNDLDHTNSVKIGMIAALTGSFASTAEEARNAAVLAVKEINESGGVLGKKIDLIVEDGRCDSAAAVSAFNKLVTVDKTTFILGGNCSSETLAIAPLLTDADVLAFANITSANTIENEGTKLFRNSPPSNYIATKAAKYVVSDLGYRKIGIITEKKEFPLDYAETFKRAAVGLGAEIVFEESFVPDTNNFQTILTKTKDNDVDVVLVSTQSGETAGIIAKQMGDSQYATKNIYNAGFNYAAYVKGGGPNVSKDFIVVTGYADESTPDARHFVESYKKEFDAEIRFNLYYIAAVYDMVYRIKDAIEYCNSFEDTACVSSHFAESTGFTGVSGNIPVSSEFAPASPLMPVGVLRVNSDNSIRIEKI